MLTIGGFFGLFDYSKPGKGVEKNEPEKSSFTLFFTILFRKFFKILQLNLLYLLFIIPFVILMIFIYSPFIMQTNPTPENHSLYVYFICMYLVLIGIAPVNTGLAYILRCYTRQEHAWVFSDFWDQIKKNIKISIKIFLVDVIITAIVLINFTIYSIVDVESLFYLVAKVILISGCILYIIMHFYLYQIIITYEVKLWSAIKNSLLFALAKLPMNILILTIVLVSGWILILFPFLFAFIGITPFVFITNFYSTRAIAKHLPVSIDDDVE